MPDSGTMGVGEITVCEGACGCVLLLWTDRGDRAHRTVNRICFQVKQLEAATDASSSHAERRGLRKCLRWHFQGIELDRPLDVEAPNAPQAC